MIDKNQEVFLSVIMSVFNEENYIEESVNSILNQTYCDFELIIVDDCSTDETVNKIRQYTDERIRLICNDRNCGLTCNLNKALNVAKGKYIVRMDGDDISIKTRFEEQVNYMEQHPEIVLSGTWIRRIGIIHDVVRYKTSNDELKIGLLFNTGMAHPTLIIRKEILDKYDIRYNEKIVYAQDYDFIYKVSKYGRIANIPKVLLKYRTHGCQISRQKTIKQKQCANITRKLLLQDLDIYLSETELILWSNFCTQGNSKNPEQEQNIIEYIISRIFESNRTKNVFNQKLLEKSVGIRKQKYFAKDTNEEEASDSKSKKMADKYCGMFLLLDQWIEINQQGKSLVDFFIQNDYMSIAVYGLGYIGERLVAELKGSNVEIKYGIDRGVDTVYSDLNIVTPKEHLENVDAVIVTPFFSYDEIKEMLQHKLDCPIISIEDVIDGI